MLHSHPILSSLNLYFLVLVSRIPKISIAFSVQIFLNSFCLFDEQIPLAFHTIRVITGNDAPRASVSYRLWYRRCGLPDVSILSVGFGICYAVELGHLQSAFPLSVSLIGFRHPFRCLCFVFRRSYLILFGDCFIVFVRFCTLMRIEISHQDSR